MLGRIPLTQPEPKPGVLAPGVYFEGDPIAPVYDAIARKVITKTTK
ncbi:hypothetical protein NBRC111894_3484 [Sporolactobacillus inulinus]|uniref:Uncharacterized protein n=1 Tax=Sporolactobacillus inulinus TaxID=2078 RepID=A0A4Y1ZG51_9BACL|nr:hypothetical protein NBRC111894_3484 [Sporolactobacillus inulinus]